MNAILKRIHAVQGNMLHTAKLDMAKMVKPSDIDVFLSDVAWAVCSTYHIVLKASPGAAIFGRGMLFDIPFIADWQKIGEHRQRLTELNNARENKGRIDYDYKVGQKVLLRKEGSAMLSPYGTKDRSSLHQFIRMDQSRFNAETK